MTLKLNEEKSIIQNGSSLYISLPLLWAKTHGLKRRDKVCFEISVDDAKDLIVKPVEVKLKK